jgi:hypothetical protein
MFWSVSTYPGPMLSSTIRLDSPTYSFLFVTSIDLFDLLASVVGLKTSTQDLDPDPDSIQNPERPKYSQRKKGKNEIFEELVPAGVENSRKLFIDVEKELLKNLEFFFLNFIFSVKKCGSSPES